MKARKPTASTPKQFIDSLPEPRRDEIARLDKLIRKTAPKLRPVVLDGGLGYGPFHYKYASGREGDACRVCIANRASYISLYALAGDENGYVAERYKKRLPKANVGKSCVRFKRLDDLDLDAVAELIRETERVGWSGM